MTIEAFKAALTIETLGLVFVIIIGGGFLASLILTIIETWGDTPRD